MTQTEGYIQLRKARPSIPNWDERSDPRPRQHGSRIHVTVMKIICTHDSGQSLLPTGQSPMLKHRAREIETNSDLPAG